MFDKVVLDQKSEWKSVAGRSRLIASLPLGRGHMLSDSDKRKQTIAWFRDRCSWLREGTHIDVELAREVVRASAVWFQKDAGPVPVPGQAEHVTWGLYGWRVYSSNSFEISLFVKEARNIIVSAYEDAIDGKAPKAKNLALPIAWRAHGCVSDYDDNLYDNYSHGRFVLAFGSHAIMAQRAAEFLIEASGYKQALAWRPDPRRSDALQRTPSRPRSPQPQPKQGNAPRKAKAPKKPQPPKQKPPGDAKKDAQAWLRRTTFDAHKKYGPLPASKKRKLSALLTQLAPLMITRPKTVQGARERDDLWVQVYLLLEGGQPASLKPPGRSRQQSGLRAFG